VSTIPDPTENPILSETGWLCPECGEFNPPGLYCQKCGAPLEDPHSSRTYSLPRRVTIPEVVQVLELIEKLPNRRAYPLPGDLQGDFDAWFDGGALRCITGTNHYELLDGTKASRGVMPCLQVTIRFPNGEVVTIEQKWD
jgi:hypothetical protein